MKYLSLSIHSKDNYTECIHNKIDSVFALSGETLIRCVNFCPLHSAAVYFISASLRVSLLWWRCLSPIPVCEIVEFKSLASHIAFFNPTLPHMAMDEFEVEWSCLKLIQKEEEVIEFDEEKPTERKEEIALSLLGKLLMHKQHQSQGYENSLQKRMAAG